MGRRTYREPIRRSTANVHPPATRAAPTSSTISNRALAEQLSASRHRERDADRAAAGRGFATPTVDGTSTRAGQWRFRNGGQALPARTAAHVGAVLGRDVSGVRVHADDEAHHAARGLGALAFASGSHVGFARGQYQPGTARGMALLAHEVAHTLQPQSHHIAREGDSDLESRLASFKQKVLDEAVKRLEFNITSLDIWTNVIRDKLSTRELWRQTGAQTARDWLNRSIETNGVRAFNAWAGESSPHMRQVYENQMDGRWRACTGCHATNQAIAIDNRIPDFAKTGPAWQAPSTTLSQMAAMGTDLSADNRQSIIDLTGGNRGSGIYLPQGTTADDFAATLSPDARLTIAAAQQIGTLLAPLGHTGYRILPRGALSRLSNQSRDELQATVLAAISRRIGNYKELIGRIRGGDVSYLSLIPILNPLLAEQPQDIRDAVAAEQARDQMWRMVKGGLTLLFGLLAIVFPPAGFVAGALMVDQGADSYSTGYNYMLGAGANNVFLPSQQDQAGGLMASGLFTMGMGLMTMGMTAAPTWRFGVQVADNTATRVAVLSDLSVTRAIAARAAQGPIPAAELEGLVQPGVFGRGAHGYLGWRGQQILYRGQGSPTSEILSPFAQRGGVSASQDMYNIMRANGLSDAQIAGYTSRFNADPVRWADVPVMEGHALGGVGIPSSRIPGVSANFAQGNQGVIYVFRVPRGMAIEVGPQGWGGVGGQAAVEQEWVFLHRVGNQYIVGRIPGSRVPSLQADNPGTGWSLDLPENIP